MDEIREPKFMTARYRELKVKCYVDILLIDEELQQVPVLVQDAGEFAALAIEIRDTAKDALDLSRASLSNGVRIQSSGMTKAPSDQRVEDEVLTQDPYQRALAEYQQARLDARLWQNLANSLDKKSFALNMVGQLIISGFLTRDNITNKRRKEIRGVNQNS